MSTYDLFACFAALCVLVVIIGVFYDGYQYRKAQRRLHKDLYDVEDDE